MDRPTPEVPAAAVGRSITKLYRKYEDKDIYIFGCGPSLFQIDPERFRDEVCFGINFAFEAMPHIDWHFAHVIETYEAMKKVVDPAKMILPETLVRQWNRGQQPILPNRIAPDSPKSYIYPIQDPYSKLLTSKSTAIEKDTSIFTWSCTTHSAIHLAAYMGAKNIYLVGVDYKPFPGGHTHFESKHLPSYGEQSWNAMSKHRKGDHWLANELKKQGVNVINLSQKTMAARKPIQRVRRTKPSYKR